MNFDLSRMRRILGVLGNPQNTYPSIHIAGTNGKGSVAAMMATVLSQAGVRTGLTTSPHLISVRERFQVDGRLISVREWRAVVKRVTKALKDPNARGVKLTEFEFLTAAAFVWFAEQKIEVAVVEVGLGGRLDATNVLEHVLLSVITTIDRDHTQWLGRSLRKISWEKAGIIRPGRPVVTGVKQGPALNVIRERCRRLCAPLVEVHGGAGGRAWPTPKYLKGPHQKLNAGIAWTALNILKDRIVPLTKKGIIHGIRETRWPGRYEILEVIQRNSSYRRKSSSADLLPGGSVLWRTSYGGPVSRISTLRRRSPAWTLAFEVVSQFKNEHGHPGASRGPGCKLFVEECLFEECSKPGSRLSPGRHDLRQLPTVRTDGRRRKLILDGAHNPAAVQALTETLRTEGVLVVDLMFGALRDKDIPAMAKCLRPVSRRVMCVPVPSPRTESPKRIAAEFAGGGTVETAKDAATGLEKLLKSPSNVPILVTGSLYLVGFIRSILRRMK